MISIAKRLARVTLGANLGLTKGCMWCRGTPELEIATSIDHSIRSPTTNNKQQITSKNEPDTDTGAGAAAERAGNEEGAQPQSSEEGGGKGAQQEP
jgi:hypothetical protein